MEQLNHIGHPQDQTNECRYDAERSRELAMQAVFDELALDQRCEYMAHVELCGRCRAVLAEVQALALLTASTPSAAAHYPTHGVTLSTARDETVQSILAAAELESRLRQKTVPDASVFERRWESWKEWWLEWTQQRGTRRWSVVSLGMVPVAACLVAMFLMVQSPNLTVNQNGTEEIPALLRVGESYDPVDLEIASAMEDMYWLEEETVQWSDELDMS